MAFITEKEVDHLLAVETRTIPGRDGRMHEFSMMRLYWRSFEYIARRVTTPELAVDISLDWAERYRIDSGTALAAYVTQRHQGLSEWLKIDKPHPPGVFPLFYLQNTSAA